MTYPTAIVIAGVLVAGAIFASGYSASAVKESGRYRIYPLADQPGHNVFRKTVCDRRTEPVVREVERIPGGLRKPLHRLRRFEFLIP